MKHISLYNVVIRSSLLLLRNVALYLTSHNCIILNTSIVPSPNEKEGDSKNVLVLVVLMHGVETAEMWCWWRENYRKVSEEERDLTT